MNSSARTAWLVAATAATVACTGRDAQSDDSVATATSEGAVSSSMSGDSADKKGVALVRVVNAAPAVSSLSIRSDETRQFGAVAYKDVTPYRSIDGTWVTFEVTGTSGGYMPLATNRELLTDGHRYTLIVMPAREGANFETRILRDGISDDPAMAQLRVINAVPGVDEIDVVKRGGDEIFGDVNFANEAGFKALEPWVGTIEVRNAKGGKVLATIPDANLEGGKSYTIIVTRQANGAYDAFWIQDSQR